MPAPAMALACSAKSGMPVPGHVEAEDLALDGLDHRRRIELQRSRDQVSVEEVVEVLVSRHPLHDRIALAVGQRLARVVVSDAGGQLLERQVDDGVGERAGSGEMPPVTWAIRARSRTVGSR